VKLAAVPSTSILELESDEPAGVECREKVQVSGSPSGSVAVNPAVSVSPRKREVDAVSSMSGGRPSVA